MNNQQSLGGAHGFLPLKGRNVGIASLSHGKREAGVAERKASLTPAGEGVTSSVRSKGFTLAEVLITLGIIGIVAAMTMPTLIENHRKKETAVKLKKAYSILSQAFQRSIADNGDPINWEFKHANDAAGNSQECGDKYIAPYLNVVKKCGVSEAGDCKTVITPLGAHYAETVVTNFASRIYAKYFLTDGTLIIVAPNVYTNDNGFISQAIRIYVDINGSKKPNMWGKDFFYFSYVRTDDPSLSDVNGKFLPNGSRYTEYELLTRDDDNSCNKDKAGWNCAALIMKQNWEITNDYPW